jgi:spore germination protein
MQNEIPRKKMFIILIGLVVFLAAFLMLFSSIATMLRPPSTHLKVIGWIPFWDQENAFKSFSSHADKFDFVSLFWYRIDKNGKVTTYKDAKEDQKIIDYAKKHKVKVLALVANLPDDSEGGDWDAKRVDRVISSAQARKKHINELLQMVERKKFDGIDIDYEALKGHQRENFSLFIEELAGELHERGKILGVAIHPKTAEYLPEEDNGSQAQDLIRLAKAADQLYFMTYLEYGKFSPPGPPGSIGWIEKVMRYAVDRLGVPREKVYMGVGLMGVRWQLESNGGYTGEQDDIPYQQIHNITQNKKIQPSWDDPSRTPFIRYSENNVTSVLWFENKDSIVQRFDLAKRLGVEGIAFWRLGGEDSAIWNQLDK